MIWIIALVMMILWMTGLITNYTMGGFIHLLLVFAVVIVLVRIIRGRPLV
ncbi:MAG: lmo0937 family membrane protein [Chitinispirillaceae bacterium]|nr:lmo0937 family membrane protein [Chitinispirillaceae bacterium]